MSLRIILEKIKSLLETETSAYSGGRQTLFFSVTDGYSPATVFNVYGEDFTQAWKRGLLELQSLPVDLLAQNLGLRIDVVESIELLSWGAMRQLLRQTPHQHVHFGIAFDPGLTQAFLEPEIAANALLYVDGLPVATPNEANLVCYSQARFGTPLCWPENDEQPVWRFTTRATYTDGVTLSVIPENKGEPPRNNSLFTMINSAADYLSRQIGETGEYQHDGYPRLEQPAETHPLFIQPLATCALLEAWEITQSKKQMAAIERSLTFLNDNLLKTWTSPEGETMAFFTERNDAIFCVGNAFTILAMAKYTELSGNSRFIAQMRRLAGGLIWMQGRVAEGFSCAPHAADPTINTCRQRAVFNGVGPLALLRLYALTLESRWLDAAERAIRHLVRYMDGSELACAVDELTRWRPLPEYYRLDLRGVEKGVNGFADLKQATAISRMMSRLAESGDSRVAEAFGEVDIHQVIETSAACGRRSYLSPDVAMFFANPHDIVGSFCRRDRGCRVRIDDVACLLSGYVHYAHYVKRREQERVERRVMTWC